MTGERDINPSITDWKACTQPIVLQVKRDYKMAVFRVIEHSEPYVGAKPISRCTESLPPLFSHSGTYPTTI